MNLSQQSVKNNNQPIRVYVRIRPTNFFTKCFNKHIQMIDNPSQNEIHIKHLQENNKIRKFTFDQVFNKYANQLEVYNAVVSPYIDEVLAGYSCTVFAYGQTGTGKTYTMIGDEKPTVKTTWNEISDIGLIPRSLNHLFCKLRSMNVEFSMRVSYLELYNEELIDLLSTNENSNIKIYDDVNRKGSIIIQGLEEVTVTNTSNVFKLLAKGQEKRKIASTLMNSQSSRSHTIFSILVHMKETNNNSTSIQNNNSISNSNNSINTSCSGGTTTTGCGGFGGGNGDDILCIGKLNLVDLAGSENISKAGNEKGIRSRETVNINQSLLTLGRVITALVERAPHIPYRQSKLTRLLQESLGGKTKTSIVATIPADQREIEETVSTLEYAYRARNIQNKPEINKKLTKHTLFSEYVEQIERLKCELVASREKNGIYLDRKTYAHLQNRIKSQDTELLEQSQLIKALEDDCAKKQKLFDEISFNLYECTKQFSLTESTLNDVKSELDFTKSKLSNVQKSSIENEDMLALQINKLMNVTTTAINDSNELHNTMDRRKLSDKKLMIAGNEFNGIMKSYLNDMNLNLEKFSESFCNRHRKIQNTFVDDLQPNNDKFFSSTMQSMNQLINHQSTDTIKLNQNKYKQLMNSLTADQKMEFDTFLDELIGNETKNNENINRKLTHHLQIIENFKNLIEHNNNKISTMFKTYENNVMELIYVQKLNIQKISDHFLQSIDKNLSVINETMQTNSNLEIDLRNALQHINRLCENSFQNNSKLITLENQLINDRENVHSMQYDSEQYNNNPNKFMDTFNRLNSFDSIISGCTTSPLSVSSSSTTANMSTMTTTTTTAMITNPGTITSNMDIHHNVNQQYELIKDEHQLQYHKMNDTIENLKKIKIIANVNTNKITDLIGKQMESNENVQEQKSLMLNKDIEIIKNSIHGVCDQFNEYKQTNEELIRSSENLLDLFISNDLKSHVTTTTGYNNNNNNNILEVKRQFIHSSKLQHNSAIVNDNDNDNDDHDDENDEDEYLSSNNTNANDNTNNNLFHQSLNSMNIGEDSSNNIENTFFNTISNCKNSTIYEPNLNYVSTTFGSISPAIAALTSSSPTTTTTPAMMNKQKTTVNQMNILDSKIKGDNNKMQRGA